MELLDVSGLNEYRRRNTVRRAGPTLLVFLKYLAPNFPIGKGRSVHIHIPEAFS